MELKAKKKIRVLLLVEIQAQEDANAGSDPLFGGPVLESPSRGQKVAWHPDHIADELEKGLLGLFPKGAYSGELWFVKSAKEAVAP